MAETRRWETRIVGHADVDPRTLAPHPLNPKVHPPEQDAVVEASLGQVGWLKSVQVNTTTGHVLDGHERIAVAIRRGEATVPVEYVTIPEADEAVALLTLDQSAQLAMAHMGRWAELRRQAQTEEPALLEFWAQYAAGQGVDGEAEPGVPEPREAPARVETCPQCGRPLKSYQ